MLTAYIKINAYTKTQNIIFKWLRVAETKIYLRNTKLKILLLLLM